ncbi:AcrB/AcrD/AcrF family protein [Candidatus Borreliella tachyglossi]|uniref:AcrB/AcrD/AcrF family protein n=1 Tax=Candidatus Borreliella tachyglossi TaxID=1964448 RepID=A0A2S1LW66_9SPIR|nr:efflux RND transporter permease subunit [Candidatus Borreliella tachyglossi]AWG42534.1 AcrB/AcrD/AcrF family protein [Candidatus Borreliella tachyglossi]
MLVKRVVDKPITMLILFLLLAMISVYTFSRLKIDLLPAIEEKVITVYTSYPGASPKEVEERVSSVLEGSFTSVKNIKKIRSNSSKGSSVITLEFRHGTNLDLALNEIRDVLEFAKNLLPKEVESPKISRFNSSSIPILTFVIYSDRSVSELRRHADSIIKPKLERLNGVGLVSVSGGSDKYVLVEISQNRLESYGLTLSEIMPVISSQNFELSIGNVLENGIEYLAQVSGKFTSIKDVENVVVAYRKPGDYSLNDNVLVQVRLKDIANIKSTFKDLERYEYYNGKSSVLIGVQKQSDANSIAVSDTLNVEIEDIKRALPRDIYLELGFDTAEYIKKSISSVTNSAYYGAVLALLIILIFLRSFRATIIVGISIPLAVVLTFCLMYFADVSLNMMSLSGLALGVGMLVDCSIAVIDNIYKYRQKGAKLMSAAILGTQEMMLPIVASTLTSICVFAPVLVFRSELGIIGDFVRDFAFTIVISLTASLFVAIFLVPVLASYYVGLYTTFQKPIKNEFVKRIDNFFAGAYSIGEVFYVKLLNYVLNRKITFSLIVFFSFIASLASFPLLNVSFLPSSNYTSVIFGVDLPYKMSLENANFYANKFLEILKSELKLYKSIISSVESSRVSFTVTFPLKEESNKELFEEPLSINYRFVKRIEDLYPNFNSRSSSGGGSLGGPPIGIKVIASNFEAAREYGSLLVSLLKKEFPELVNPRLDIREEELQIDIDIDRDKAYSYGINMNALAKELKANIDGVVAGKYIEDGLNYDIVLRLSRDDVANLKDLDKIFITNASGIKIPLSSIAKLRKTKGVSSILRENQSLVVNLTAGIPPGENLGLITARVMDFVTNKVPQRDGVSVSFEGEYSEFTKNMRQFALIIFMAILLVFGIMASQFESLLKPFIILFTIPLTSIGVALIYLITRENISVFTAVGMLMLVGVVVNTGIVLVDYSNLLLKRGVGLREAVVEGGRSRFRPVLMSALTSIIGLVPLAFSDSSGSELVKPIAFTFIGGMTASTFLTLLFIPMIFEVFSKPSRKKFILFKSLNSTDKNILDYENKELSQKNADNTYSDKNNVKDDNDHDNFFIEENED